LLKVLFENVKKVLSDILTSKNNTACEKALMTANKKLALNKKLIQKQLIAFDY
jgi:hypothetical protein